MFRVWDNKRKKMLYDNIFIDSIGIVYVHYAEDIPSKWFSTIYSEPVSDFKIDLFTGRKDKNGKHIYVGDILKIKRKVSDEIVLIHYVDERMSFEIENMSGFGGFSNILKNTFDESEVIGNKYENQEIIKMHKEDIEKFLEEWRLKNEQT